MILYFAEKDENIWDISKKYKVSPEILMKNNGLTEETLKDALMLRI
ncbi:MAG: LysM peptidoglycan-binding domain-containing protein [Clostridia bacterium]|nr:LysM peptidoglycan-binding domain-containing protein [Clostridia bacterium]